MRSSAIFLALLVALAAGCVDGVTPDCSKVNCGTPTSDAATSLDAQSEASTLDATAEASTDAGGGDAKSDASVDAKTD